MYVDGVLVSTINYNIGGDFDWDAAPQDGYLGLGCVNNLPFDGNIDQISFWDRALSSEEILNHLVENPSSNEDNLSTYLEFNESEGTTSTDLSGNGNDGTIYGATWSGDVPAPPVFGCTDSYADNFNSEATSDDGSCYYPCLLYTSPSPRDMRRSRMPSSA